MRRRFRSAALPLHRHSLPQVAIDGALVALAYLLAYRLRFDNGTPDDYADLRNATILPAVAAALILLTAFRGYEKWWRYTGRRDELGVLQAVILFTAFVPLFNAMTHPVTRDAGPRGEVALTVP